LNLNDKRKKVFSNKLESQSRPVVIGGVSDDEIKDLPTKEQILRERITEAEIKARRYLQQATEKAEAEAEAIITRAREEEQFIRDTAYNEGFEKGEQDATNTIHEKFSTILSNSANILNSLEQEKREALEDEENSVLDFIFILAEKIIGKELSLDKESMLGMVKTAISELNYKQDVSLFLPPETALHLNKVKKTILSEFPDLENLVIVADSALKDGDLIVESKKERLDFRLAAQINALAENLKQKRIFKAEEIKLKTETEDF
jgi:flagellar assembly protein FliH